MSISVASRTRNSYGLIMTKTSTAEKLQTLVAILDTYEGMASLYDGEGEYTEHIAHVFDRIDELKLEIAALEAK